MLLSKDDSCLKDYVIDSIEKRKMLKKKPGITFASEITINKEIKKLIDSLEERY